MIEVNLHPSGDKKRRKKGGGLSGIEVGLPDFGDVEILESIRSDPWNAAFIGSLVIVPLLVLGLWLGQRSESQQLQERLDSALADSARLADLRALTDSITSRRAEIRDRVQLVRELDGNRYVWPHLMDQVAAALPSNAWIESVSRRSPLPDLSVQLEGTAGTALVITDFVRNLESSAYVEGVQIVGSQRQMEDGVSTQSFTLNVKYGAREAGSSGSRTALAGRGD